MLLDEWPDLSDLLDKVQELLELGLIDDAQRMLDNYQSAFQDYWEYHFLYSRVYAERNQPRKAISCLITGLRLEADNVDCLIGLFYSYAMMNQVKRGGKFLLKAENLYPDNDMVMSALIWYYTELNEPERAVYYFEKATMYSSNNPDTYRNGGIAFDRLGRFEEAEACYKAALLLSPNFEEARDLYADHLIFTGRTDDAVKVYEDVLRDSPENIRYMSKLIYCLSQKGSFDDAAALAKRSIELYPNSPVGYIDLAYVNLNTGGIDEAAANADMAISVSPIESEGYRVKAIAYSERGDYAAAEELFEKAAALDPDNPDILRDYYQHLRVAGSHRRMIDTVEKVIRLEYPYCTEDYWFLADYYREKKQNLKAFRYLRLAYDSMPAEKELLPPMIEILMERGHTKYSLPIFANYVQRSGWNDAMSAFAMNQQFRDRSTQEGMRFLRFTGQRPAEFRRYIFNYYLYRFGLIYYTIIMIALLFPASVLLGWVGALGVAALYGMSMVWIKVFRLLRMKKTLAKGAKPQNRQQTDDDEFDGAVV
jgi:tetratricopeptide (TPR) repeat protein